MLLIAATMEVLKHEPGASCSGEEVSPSDNTASVAYTPGGAIWKCWSWTYRKYHVFALQAHGLEIVKQYHIRQNMEEEQQNLVSNVTVLFCTVQFYRKTEHLHHMPSPSQSYSKTSNLPKP
jgi:hypothetical protein